MKCDKNPEKIKQLFNDISSYYDKMNNVISFGSHFIIKYLALKELNLQPTSFVLDLCCGTGDFSKIISKISPKTKIIGLDFSAEMIKLAKTKNPNGVFVQGDCTNLPFHNEEFNHVTMGFGLRNIQDRKKALDEIYRVLSKDGKFLHLDFGQHNFLSNIFNQIVPILAKIYKTKSAHYQYLLDSKNEFPEPDELIKEFETHGFKHEKTLNYLFGAISAQIMTK